MGGEVSGSMKDLHDDLRERWQPSPGQIELARAVLDTTGAEYVYTTHVLRNKHYGFWTEDVTLRYLDGVFVDRTAMFTYLEAMMAEVEPFATGGYTIHRVLGGEDHWAVFEDISTAKRIRPSA